MYSLKFWSLCSVKGKSDNLIWKTIKNSEKPEINKTIKLIELKNAETEINLNEGTQQWGGNGKGQSQCI